VVSTLCLFLILGGGAYAALTIPKNSIGSKQIKDGSVALKDLESKARDQLEGAAGTPGGAGPQGAAGPAGADGSSIVARVNSTSGLTTSATPAAIPLAGGSWTQAGDEVNEVMYSPRLVYTPPVSGGCGSPGVFGSITLEVKVNGELLATRTVSTQLDGVQRTAQLGGVGNVLAEPGAVTPRVVTVEISDPCPAPGDDFQIHSLAFSVVGVR
jgi:hypothetical protein